MSILFKKDKEHYQSHISITHDKIVCLLQGAPGLPGLPGEPGPEGIGFPGPKVNQS